MPRPRKTVTVEHVKAVANRMLGAGTTTQQSDIRLGVIALLENVLHATENYRGFRYTDTTGEPGTDEWTVNDDTRREYC